jgi:uncharacterized protein YjbI with pentapeptide repeats
MKKLSLEDFKKRLETKLSVSRFNFEYDLAAEGPCLQGADLREADLGEADLQGADLREADLQGADLRGADLRGTCLQGADLRGADLRGACLQGADLRGADLDEAKVAFATVNFSLTELKQARTWIANLKREAAKDEV